jgi:hypothetical protein
LSRHGLALVLLSLVACRGGLEHEPSPYALDDLLTPNHGQFIGTHNSTHLEPELLPTREWAYSHAPLIEQFASQGVRQIELDVHLGPDGLEVYHVPGLDEETTCRSFRVCLELIRIWSDTNPGHFPILVLVEPKDDIDPEPLSGRLDEIDAEILSVWPPSRLIVPDGLRAGAPTLREAVWGRGWPPLSETRGKLIFTLLDRAAHRDEYSRGGESLEGRVMFVPGRSLEDPLNAVMSQDDPVADLDLIGEAVRGGILVRTRADGDLDAIAANDPTTLETALASGAQYLSTNWPVPVSEQAFFASIPEGSPGRCNPVTAPPGCEALLLENPAFLGY